MSVLHGGIKMRKTLLFTLPLLALVGAQSALAVDLKDCSKGTTKTRLACLQSNIVLLNSSYQTVAAELRKDVSDLQNQVATLTDKVNKLPPPPNLDDYVKKADIADVVRKGKPVRIGPVDSERCLDVMSGESGSVPVQPPLDINRFAGLRPDCNSPAWRVRD